jgi:hypothetical protein
VVPAFGRQHGFKNQIIVIMKNVFNRITTYIWLVIFFLPLQALLALQIRNHATLAGLALMKHDAENFASALQNGDYITIIFLGSIVFSIIALMIATRLLNKVS